VIEERNFPKVEAPSRAKLAIATVVALIIASIVLVTTILPAEYGIDPLGAGAALGLVNLSTAEGAAGATPAPMMVGVNVPQAGLYKVDAQDFELTPGTGFEFKYKMEKGAVMVYSWKSSSVVEFEFHGEPDVKPNKDYYESYVLDKAGKAESFGSFTAPSTGVHGWYWKNNGNEPAKIRLTTAGFYEHARMYSNFGVEDFPVEEVK
jgi:hypothetical protein